MDMSVALFLIAWVGCGLLGGLLVLLNDWLGTKPGAEFVVSVGDLGVGFIMVLFGCASLVFVTIGLFVSNEGLVLRLRKPIK